MLGDHKVTCCEPWLLLDLISVLMAFQNLIAPSRFIAWGTGTLCLKFTNTHCFGSPSLIPDSAWGQAATGTVLSFQLQGCPDRRCCPLSALTDTPWRVTVPGVSPTHYSVSGRTKLKRKRVPDNTSSAFLGVQLELCHLGHCITRLRVFHSLTLESIRPPAEEPPPLPARSMLSQAARSPEHASRSNHNIHPRLVDKCSLHPDLSSKIRHCTLWLWKGTRCEG